MGEPARLPVVRYRGVRFGVFEADLEARELRKHGIRIKLSGQPFQALELLLVHPGEVVRRENLRDAIWPDHGWGEHDHQLNKIINRLREALSDSADTPRFIETIPKVGYRFLVPVERADIYPMVAPVVPEPTGPIAVPHAPRLEVVPPARKRWAGARVRLVIGGVLVGMVVVAALLFVGWRHPAASHRFAEPVPLTTYVGSESQPSWSPDGRQVVFAWDGGVPGSSHIYTAAVSGGDARRITDASAEDARPAWSPRGDSIAFVRETGPVTSELWLVQPDGANPRKLREILSTADSSLTWTKDEKALIVAQRSNDHGIPALFHISTSTGEQRQITFPSFPVQSGGDLSPAVSPDGKRLAFTRSTSPAWRDIFVIGLSPEGSAKGQPVRVTDVRTIIDHVAWMPDGGSLIYSAGATAAGSRHLFRVDGLLPGQRREVSDLGLEGEHPAIAGPPFRIVFVRKNIEQSSIWRLDLASPDAEPRQRQLVSSTRRDYTTDLSPDGSQIVFSSVRSGSTEVWLSRTDGSNLQRLTSSGGLAPRWSPDGKRIAFESSQQGQPDVYVLNLGNGAVERLTSEGPFNVRPAWSRDGRFVYFCSNRTGRPQIWKVPSQGGDPVQITRQGGQYAVETFDQKSIYYTSPDRPSQVWTTSVNGGDEMLAIANTAGFATIAASPQGLYYLADFGASGARLNFFSFADRSTRTLATLDHPVHQFLSSSRDGRSVLYSQVDRQDSDLMLLGLAH